MSTVLVTGSSRGIGAAIATEFSSYKNNVILNCSNNVSVMENVATELKHSNPNVMGVQADVSDYEQCKEMFKTIENKFGNIDILINNVGIAYNGLFHEMDPSDWKNIMAVNLDSVYNCCHLAIPSMIKNKKGVIINISSIWGVSGVSCEAVYSASKGAINSFTKALGRELAPSGIRVNAIACGVVDTVMNDFLSNEEKDILINEIPAMRLAKTQEIADLSVFLASENSKYIIGQTITIDGGLI